MLTIEEAKQRLLEALEGLKNDKCCGSCDAGEETLGTETSGDSENIDIPDEEGDRKWN